jgi:hypothetical protein
MAWRSLLDDSLMGARMIAGLPRFLRQPPPDAAQSRAVLEASLRNRARVFLELLKRAVFEHAASRTHRCCGRPQSRMTSASGWFAITASKARSRGCTTPASTSL